MKNPLSVVVLVGAFVLGLSVAVPAQDIPDTPYDESESLPYQGAPSSPNKLIEEQARADRPMRMFVALFRASTDIRPDGNSPVRTERAGEPVRESLAILNCALRC